MVLGDGESWTLLCCLLALGSNIASLSLSFLHPQNDRSLCHHSSHLPSPLLTFRRLYPPGGPLSSQSLLLCLLCLRFHPWLSPSSFLPPPLSLKPCPFHSSDDQHCIHFLRAETWQSSLSPPIFLTILIPCSMDLSLQLCYSSLPHHTNILTLYKCPESFHSLSSWTVTLI